MKRNIANRDQLYNLTHIIIISLWLGKAGGYSLNEELAR